MRDSSKNESNDSLISQYKVKEYEYLRKDHSESIQETRSIERNAVISTAAIWTWLLTTPQANTYKSFVVAIPLIICILGALRSVGLVIRIERIASYTRKVETQNSDDSFSWESSLARMHWFLTGTAVVFWAIMLTLNLAATWLYFR
jgi:hypothetical protein